MKSVNKMIFERTSLFNRPRSRARSEQSRRTNLLATKSLINPLECQALGGQIAGYGYLLWIGQVYSCAEINLVYPI